MSRVRRTDLIADVPPEDENSLYLDPVWGVLRVPVACIHCGTLTRLPSYHDANGPTGPTCGPCFRLRSKVTEP